ncbi:unknown [Ruminococcus sp. CAG:403]|nr:unknown [Ruminococcus sp. CAG:403]
MVIRNVEGQVINASFCISSCNNVVALAQNINYILCCDINCNISLIDDAIDLAHCSISSSIVCGSFTQRSRNVAVLLVCSSQQIIDAVVLLFAFLAEQILNLVGPVVCTNGQQIIQFSCFFSSQGDVICSQLLCNRSLQLIYNSLQVSCIICVLVRCAIRSYDSCFPICKGLGGADIVCIDGSTVCTAQVCCIQCNCNIRCIVAHFLQLILYSRNQLIGYPAGSIKASGNSQLAVSCYGCGCVAGICQNVVQNAYIIVILIRQSSRDCAEINRSSSASSSNNCCFYIYTPVGRCFASFDGQEVSSCQFGRGSCFIRIGEQQALRNGNRYCNSSG